MKHFITPLLLTLFFACKKETPIPEENKQLANQFQNFLEAHHFRLAAYYSETPFDYEPTDTVGAKTNHWEYVSFHLKDDELQFIPSTNTVTINQNNNWMPGTTEIFINRQYDVVPDQKGVEFKFVNFQYEPLDYRLENITDTSFVVRAQYKGNDVISRFKVIQ